MALKVPRANKKATKGKRKAWKKGQSSSYNPEFKKYRQLAKKRILFGNSGEGQLTQNALALHNKISASKDSEKDCEEISLSEKTFVTAFSDCTNPSFSRLLNHWKSTSSLHKEMLAVLAAVTEVLKSNGGKETETEYFAALMTTLDAVETDEAITAVITLLHMVVRRLTPPVLRFHFEKSSAVLAELLVKYMNSDYNALLRNLLGCLYHFLKAQVPTSWSSSTVETYNVLLEFATHQKPKVRKMAQQAICALLRTSEETDQHTKYIHPAAIPTAQYCIKNLEANAGNASNVTFHTLALMKEVIAYFPKSSLKLSCETILRAMTLSNALTTSCCLKTLRGLFESKPKAENLPTDLNIRIIKALYDYQPNVNDNQTLIVWIQVMESTFLNLYRLDSKICISHLPVFFKKAVACWLSTKDDVRSVVSSTLQNIVRSYIQPSSAEFQQLLLENPTENPVQKMFHYVEEALSYQFHESWKYVLAVLSSFFDVIGKHCFSFMIKCLKSLADMRDSYNFPYIVELDRAFGIAIHRMGPDIVLNAIPLQIDGENDKLDFPRSWLLPLLRDYTKETKLQFFINFFLPLASKLRKKVIQYEQENRVVESKTYDVICSQIWSLLPGFCTHPTDLIQSFKNIAKILGMTLSEQPALRTTILNSLRTLIMKNLENDENKQELARFAKNYLSILFNLYTTETKNKAEEDVRLAVYDTIKVYLQITDTQLCELLFSQAMEKLKNPRDLFTQHALIDLCRAMLPYVNEMQVKQFYEYCKPLLQHTNHTLQKKCYSVLNQLCSSPSENCALFVKNSLEELKSLLLTSLSSSASPSKALRLNCLKHVIHHLDVENKEFVTAVIPEAVLCTKETAIKARTAAFSLLVEIGHTFKKWQSTNPTGALREYMQFLLAGLASSPHMMSATILALGQVMYEFKDELDSDIIHLIIENMCLLLTSKSREVVTSALSFVKILFSVVNTADLAQHIEFLVKNITNISKDNQRHFRFKAKELFTRLIRKFGYEMIAKLVPESYQKQLTNIRKTEARKLRIRESRKIANDEEEEVSDCLESHKHKTDLIDDILEDSDDDIAEKEKISNKTERKMPKKKKQKVTFIDENAETEIVDFLDAAVSKKILGNKPDKVEKKKRSEGFEMTKDGRLIIKDKEEDDDVANSNIAHSRKRKLNVDESLNDNSAKKQKKTKQKILEANDDDDDSVVDLPQSQVVAKGIHRNVKSSQNSVGEKYKAKKAGGDVNKGKLEPYAYIPFNRNALNKRKKAKLQGQFKGIVKAAKHGAQKGLKRKARQAMRKKR